MLNFFKMQDDFFTKLASLALVLALHVALLYGVLIYSATNYKLIPQSQEAVTLFVNLINLPAPKKPESPPEPAKPQAQKVKLAKPAPVSLPKPAPMLVTNASVMVATEPLVLLTEPVKLAEAQVELTSEVKPEAQLNSSAETAPKSAVPVTLSTELSVSCPQRVMPNYPAASRRQNEQGQVVLRVELDETGHITSAHVATSSGYKRLDEAGLAAIKNWQCNPSSRNGTAVRAVALQPFDFILDGR